MKFLDECQEISKINRTVSIGYIDNNDKVPNINFIDVLERENIPYTGSSKRVYCLSKSDFVGCRNTPIIYDNITEVKYPAFVKMNNSGCSENIDEGAIVYNYDELINQLTKFNNNYIIQEYIDDNEYTVFIFANKNGEVVCLDPLEIKFDKLKTNFLTHDIKLNQFDDVIYRFCLI